MKKTELLNKIATLLGGRVAEEIVFEDISTGAHNDLARATDIARSMVKEYGMSERLGKVYFSREKRQQFLPGIPDGAQEYSESTAEAIDDEVKQIIDGQYKRAHQLLSDNKELLEKGANKLLAQEKLEADELDVLMASVRHEPTNT
jgi:cell division protease FtsH